MDLRFNLSKDQTEIVLSILKSILNDPHVKKFMKAGIKDLKTKFAKGLEQWKAKFG